MRKRSAPFIQTFVILCGLFLGLTQTGPAQTAQEQDEEQWQVPKSRSFPDNIWKVNRKKEPQRRPTRRRKYERVGVAGNSATPIRYGKPGAGGSVSSAPNRRRPAPVKPPVWQDVLLDTSEQVGVTIWRLRKCGTGGGKRCFLELRNEQGDGAMYEALRVSTAADFREGDGIQLAVESRAKGYVYVLHQEVYADGRTGEPKLLFPQREGVNAVAPGHPLLVPAQGEDGAVKVLKMRNALSKPLAAERLRVIVVPRPIEGLFVQDRPRHISDADVSGWESLWAGRLELFDLAGGGDERMSLNEWHAMRDVNRARDLTTEDLSPQKLYVVERKRNDGVLFTLELPYGN
jgi:hypothetical protein